jgi:HK97 gp10 family phage protein
MSLAGMGVLTDYLKLMVANAAEVEIEALEAAAVPILKDAQSTTAFIDRTGNLRDSLKISKVVKKRAGYRVIKVYCVRTGGEGYEANLVEYGHSGKYAAAHPFMAPAFERHQEEAAEIITGAIKQAIYYTK